MEEFDISLAYARTLDTQDPLRKFHGRFYNPGKKIYLDGNSLGLCPIEGEELLLHILNDWKTLGIDGWLDGSSPWFYLAEKTGILMAPLVGAIPDEVICTGTTTVNLHALLSTFYQPKGSRTKILADEKNFPSDIYAIKSHLKMRDYDPREHLVLVRAESDGFLSQNRIIENMTDEVLLAILPSVLFRNGQLLNIRVLTEEAHKKGIIIGFDCSHSAGVVPHNLSNEKVDFAFWCGYKYLNGGPGCPAFIYLNKSHFTREPLMAGWFGYNKQKQFEMNLDFEHEKSAGGWQISTPAILSMAPLQGSLNLFHEAGIDQVREKSLKLTSYFIFLADQLLADKPYSFSIGTPRDPVRRGGHIALTRENDAWRICAALKKRNIIPDFRSPDIIRIAPSPFYCRFEDIWILARALQEVIDSGEYKEYQEKVKPVS